MNSRRPQKHTRKTTVLLILSELFLFSLLAIGLLYSSSARTQKTSSQSIIPQSGSTDDSSSQSFIKWVDFDVTAEAMRQALRLDVDSYNQTPHLNWLELLAFLGARYGGDFSRYKASDMDALAQKLQADASIEELTKDMKYYSYYLEAYRAVLGGMVGVYDIQIPDESTGEPVWVTKYGLKAFSPIAKNYPYNDFDDFGVSRSYGFKRQHLGHDLMGQVGTPVIAVESGYVEAIGWNQYGGWRLGIRSFDKKRYYYYAHLRKNYPYHKTLKEGSYVQAGDVIGYLGRTGYSPTENTNNIDEPHLHFGMQLIFDESQKEGNNEIWINCYELAKFLTMNRSETVKNPETKEYYRVYQIKDPAVPGEAPSQIYSFLR
ncbi:MAG: M23 family metallopeptidase [Lachnospiraceae bacterium]|nr:M23 family metallopeptidase [Lachnospiraceae bacterium]